jgi:hypothetical protein
MRTVPRVPLDRPATYDDLVAQPEHLVAEIVDGELWTSPRPAPKHSRAYSASRSVRRMTMVFGIIIRMFMEVGAPHHRPHFHAAYQDTQ